MHCKCLKLKKYALGIQDKEEMEKCDNKKVKYISL